MKKKQSTSIFNQNGYIFTAEVQINRRIIGGCSGGYLKTSKSRHSTTLIFLDAAFLCLCRLRME